MSCRRSHVGRLLGRNPISLLELRSPHEYVTIAKALGLPGDKANDVIYRNPQRALEHASRTTRLVFL